MTELFEGLEVLTLEVAVAAPLCTRHLVDLGATVTKIEPPGGGDFMRGIDRAVHGWSSHFTWLNGGKRSVAVDLKLPLGRAVFDRMLDRADVFVCNLAPAARERLIPDRDIVANRPGLVRCYISGYGNDGPFAQRKAFDSLVQGEAGVIASTGTADAPAKCGISIADVGAGTYAFALISAALARRGSTGLGSRIDVSLFDVLTYWLSPLLLAARNGDPPPPPRGARHATIVPYGTFQTASGTTLNIAVQNEPQWVRLCGTVLCAPELATDPRWMTNADRVAGRDVLEPLLEKILGGLDEDELVARLEAADVPWGRVNSIAEVIRHPQLETRERWSRVLLEDKTSAEILTPPFLIDGLITTAESIPAVGEHTVQVMADLGFSDAEVAMVRANGVVDHSLDRS
jgi:itaconate CoA-transferase